MSDETRPVKKYVAYGEVGGSVIIVTRQEAIDIQKIAMNGRFVYTSDEDALNDYIVTHYAWDTDEATYEHPVEDHKGEKS